MLEQVHATRPKIRVFDTLILEVVVESVLDDVQAGIALAVFSGCCTFFPTSAQTRHTLDLRPYVEAVLDQATIYDWCPAHYQSFLDTDRIHVHVNAWDGTLLTVPAAA